MPSFQSLVALPLSMLCLLGAASAQRHDAGSAPPTAPPLKQAAVPPPAAPPALSDNLGPIQFSTANYIVSAPQSLSIEVQSSSDRVRTAALAAVGAPGQYLSSGHSPFAHSVHLDFIALGNSNELDAVLTVELDHHIVSAILAPEDQQWHHIATAIYPTTYSDPTTTPSTFLRTDRSLLEPLRYTAVFHATTNGTNGDFTDNEAYLRVLNGHAVITMSFASIERACDPTHQHPCEITQRWLQHDITDPEHRFLLVTATGHVRPNDANDPIAHAETFETAHLRTFSCQPFAFSDQSLHFEPTSDPTPCQPPHDPQHDTSHDTAHDQPLH